MLPPRPNGRFEILDRVHARERNHLTQRLMVEIEDRGYIFSQERGCRGWLGSRCNEQGERSRRGPQSLLTPTPYILSLSQEKKRMTNGKTWPIELIEGPEQPPPR